MIVECLAGRASPNRFEAMVCEPRRYRSDMRLTGKSDDEPLAEAWAYLTVEQAFHLYLSLAYYFDDEDDPGWHCHVGGDCDGEPELTIAIDK